MSVKMGHYMEYVKSIYDVHNLCAKQRVMLTTIWNTHNLSRLEFENCARKWREYWRIKNPQWKIGECRLSFNRQASFGKITVELIDTGRK